MTIQMTPAIATQMEAWKNNEIVFPHGMGDEAIDYIASMEMTGDTDFDWYVFAAQQERMIRDTGRVVISIPYEKDGEVVKNKDGETIPEFSYTKGNFRNGLPEFLTFYPAAQTSHFVLNKVSRLIKEGALAAPEMGIATCAFGILPNPELPVVMVTLNAERQSAADKEYTCQKDHDEAPVVLIGIPMPNGDFTATTPHIFLNQFKEVSDVKEVTVAANA